MKFMSRETLSLQNGRTVTYLPSIFEQHPKILFPINSKITGEINYGNITRELNYPRRSFTFNTVSAACNKKETIMTILQNKPASIKEPAPDPLQVQKGMTETLQ